MLERALRTLVVGNFAVVTLWSWPVYSCFLVAKDFSRYVDRIVPTAPADNRALLKKYDTFFPTIFHDDTVNILLDMVRYFFPDNDTFTMVLLKTSWAFALGHNLPKQYMEGLFTKPGGHSWRAFLLQAPLPMNAVITRASLQNELETFSMPKMNKERVFLLTSSVFEMFDINRDGALSFREFSLGCLVSAHISSKIPFLPHSCRTDLHIQSMADHNQTC